MWKSGSGSGKWKWKMEVDVGKKLKWMALMGHHKFMFVIFPPQKSMNLVDYS